MNLFNQPCGHLLKQLPRRTLSVVCFTLLTLGYGYGAFAQSVPATVTVEPTNKFDAFNRAAPSNKVESFLPPPELNSTEVPLPKILNQSVNNARSSWDLRQLWNELRANNPQLIAAREAYFAAKATVPQINAPANPTVGLVVSGMPGSGSPLAFGTAGTSPQSQNAFSFQQPFQFPGKRSLAADIADTSAEALQARNENLYLQYGAQLASLYYSTLASQRQLKVLSETVVRTELIKNIAKARYANYSAAYVEFLNAQVSQSAAESDRFTLERQLAVAYKNINVLIGRDPREKLVLRGDPGAAVRKVPTLVELESYAESSHPLLKSSLLQVDAAKKGVTYAKKAYLPDFQIIGTNFMNRSPFAANNSASYYQIEFDIVIPLYFFMKERYGVEQAVRNQAAIEASNTSMHQEIILGVGSSYASYEQIKKLYEFLRDRQLPVAEAAYKVSLIQYANNGQGFNDLMTAQIQLRSIEIQLALAESNLMQAQATLFAAAGKDPIE